MSSWVSQDGQAVPDAKEDFLPKLQSILNEYVQKDKLLYKQFRSMFEKSHSQLQEVFARFDKVYISPYKVCTKS